MANQEEAEERTRFQNSIQEKVSTFVNTLKGRIGNMVNVKSSSDAALFLDVDKDEDMAEVIKFTVPKVMYLSPLYAPDEFLQQLPPVKLVVYFYLIFLFTQESNCLN